MNSTHSGSSELANGSCSDGGPDKGNNAFSAVSAEQNSLLIFHIDADNAVVLSTRFSTQGQADAATERKEVPAIQACSAKDFASHLLAEFMWGTLDAETGKWVPVSETPSCEPPFGDDSLITFGQFLRTRNTAAEPGNPVVCENIRRALQSVGQVDTKNKLQQKYRRKKNQLEACVEGNTDRDCLKESKFGDAKPEVLNGVHTQLMKRMALPLTVRLGLGCEIPDAGEILKPLNTSIDGQGSGGDSLVRDSSVAASPPAFRTAHATRAENASTISKGDPSTPGLAEGVAAAHTARLNSGYWYTMPQWFHTIFRMIREKVDFRLVFYTRDHANGEHIRSLVREINDLCEGNHPAFNGENRTKQVFLDGRKRSRDLRISDCQIGSLSLTDARGTTPQPGPSRVSSCSASHCVEEGPPQEGDSTDGLCSNTLGGSDTVKSNALHRNRPQCAYKPGEYPVWRLNFPGSDTQYEGIQEIYTAITHDMLQRHNVICLCFGTPPAFEAGPSFGGAPTLGLNGDFSGSKTNVSSFPIDAPVCLSSSGGPEQAGASDCLSSERGYLEATVGDRGTSCLPKSSKSSAPQPPALWEEGVEDQPKEDTVQYDSSSAASGCVATEKATPPEQTWGNVFSASGTATGDVEMSTKPSSCPYSLHGGGTFSPDDETATSFSPPSCCSFSLSAPLTPLPVLVDPADLTLHNVCIGSPSVLSVSDGLSYISTLSVLEVVHGTVLFDSLATDKAPTPSSDANASGFSHESKRRERQQHNLQRHCRVAEASGSRSDANGTTKMNRCSYGVFEAEQSPEKSLLAKEKKLSAYLVVDPVYSVVMPEPCSLIANLDYLCNLVQVILARRLRLLSPGSQILQTRWKSVTLWNAGNVSSDFSNFSAKQKNPDGSTANKEERPHPSSVNPHADNRRPVSMTSLPGETATHCCGQDELQQRRFLTFLDPFVSLRSDEIKALPTRDYLKATVIPVLLPAIESVTRDRPDDPVSWIAFYLLRHAKCFNRMERQRGLNNPATFPLFASIAATPSASAREMKPLLIRNESSGSSLPSSSPHVTTGTSGSTAGTLKKMQMR
ncbi:Dpy-30 motif protein [Toxoplasma gondii p89]|uniref:Dpy-30 motif protein n=1 Tax=Toxoplasma gondii p89 TaxID=943119 RepID=A0A086L5D7_TOXGO|nr:Dpy-30 motif protein [Toxoplasma gondii p89]